MADIDKTARKKRKDFCRISQLYSLISHGRGNSYMDEKPLEVDSITRDSLEELSMLLTQWLRMAWE
jgi:hypothetical protein